MAKKKKFPNQLKIQDWLKDRMFIGVNGRFGMTQKAWSEFTFDELVEFSIAHNKKTVDKHLQGVVPPDYVGPFDKQELPIKPNKEEDKDGEE